MIVFGRGRSGARRAGLLAAALLGASALATQGVAHAGAVSATCGNRGVLSTDAGVDTCAFSTYYADVFTVPAGVGSVTVVAVGGSGGGAGVGAAGGGGAGDRVSGRLAVTAGERLFVYVGGNGYDPDFPSLNGGGHGGYGATQYQNGGPGGGASDIRTCSEIFSDLNPPSCVTTSYYDQDGQLASRVLVAGGGGGEAGAGGAVGGAAGTAGSDGDAGANNGGTVSPAGGGGGGQGATPGAGGSAGSITDPADVGGTVRSGSAGTGDSPWPGVGGDGASTAGSSIDDGGGGGGGGGYAGGGGGGSGLTTYYGYVHAAGGGGGSDLVPPGGTATTPQVALTPTVQISWTEPPSATIASPMTGGAYLPGQVVPTSFSCADSAAGTGLASCADSNGATSGAGQLDTSTTGAHTYTVTATSRDGETGTSTLAYSVKAPVALTGRATPNTDYSGHQATISDTVTFTSTSGGTPTGTVHFALYSDSGCTVVAHQLGDSALTTDSSGTTSSTYSLAWVEPAVGVLHWQATYSGDDRYSGFTTPCGDPGQQLSIGYVVKGFPGTSASYRAGSTIKGSFQLETEAGGTVSPIPDGQAQAIASACSATVQFDSGPPVCATYATGKRSTQAFGFSIATDKKATKGTHQVVLRVYARSDLVNTQSTPVTLT